MEGKTAIIVVNYRTAWHADKCLESVFKYTQSFHLFLVQNKPDQASIDVANKYATRYPEYMTVIVNDTNLGYVGGVNSAYAEAIKYERVCFLNSDMIVTQDWLVELNKVFDENPQVVQVAPDTNSHYGDKMVWKIIRRLPWGLNRLYKLQMRFNPPRHPHQHVGYTPHQYFYEFPGGYCNLVRSKYFTDLGYFLDPNIIHGYWDDFDLGFYLAQFGETGSTNRSYVYHFLNVSINNVSESRRGMKQDLVMLNSLYVMDKWRDRLRGHLAKMSGEEMVAATHSYVIQSMLIYFGMVDVAPHLVKYIRSIPAREIGKTFLN